jgi:hypothetical protein
MSRRHPQELLLSREKNVMSEARKGGKGTGYVQAWNLSGIMLLQQFPLNAASLPAVQAQYDDLR